MKKYILKKQLLLVLLSFLAIQINAQIETTVPVVTYPHPSASALLKATINPVNYSTGVPEISLNVMGLKTVSKNIHVNTALSYNTSGLSLNDKVGDTGMGWSLAGVPTISKLVKNDPDFRSRPDLVTTTEDDIFVYNFHGNTGNFRIIKDGIRGYKVQYLNPTNLVIEIVMNNNASSSNQVNLFDEVDYFTIFDENGNKYIFDIYDTKMAIFFMMLKNPNATFIPYGDNPPPGFEPYQKTGAAYRSSYYLSTVKDPNNQTIVRYVYEPFVRPKNINSNTSLNEKENKLKEIINTNNDKIVFDYTYTPSASLSYIDKPNSDFQLNSVRLLNNANTLLKKVDLIYDDFYINYNYYSFDLQRILSRKILKEFREYNNNNSNYIATKFEYNQPQVTSSVFANCNELNYGRDLYGYLNLKHKEFPVVESSFPNDIIPEYSTWYTEPSVVTTGALSKIIHPTGGCTMYEFESNTFSDSSYENLYGESYYVDLSISNVNHFNNELQQNIISFNTAVTNTYNFSVSGSNSKSLYFNFNSEPFYSTIHTDPNEALIPTYRIVGPNGPLYEIRPTGYISDFLDNSNNYGTHYLSTYHPCIGNRFELQPGNYSIQVISYYSDTSANGIITISEKTPSNNVKKYFYGGGLRIKKIATFDHSNVFNDIESNNLGLVEYVAFEYNNFDTPNRSSYDVNEFSITSLNNSTPSHEALIDYAPYYANVKVIRGKNASNGYEKLTFCKFSDLPPIDPRHKNIFRYSFRKFANDLLKKHEIFNADSKKVFEKEVEHSYLVDPKFFGWFYSNQKISKNYFYPNGLSTAKIKQINETFAYNPVNKLIAESTSNSSSGETLKTKYFYHTGNSIYSKNRIAEIESIETYRGAELLSKSKINYGNVWQNNVSLLPQTIVTAKGANSFENRVEYIQYDEFSNPLEVKQTTGIPITYIWGYNKTQPIAKIENATYAQVQSYVANLQTASNGPNEGAFITALSTFRTTLKTALPNAMITTFTYKPLVGISTVTDPHENVTTYHYDTYNRLEFVKDKQGNILSENKYHYKN